jgi:hypothetical protein
VLRPVAAADDEIDLALVRQHRSGFGHLRDHVVLLDDLREGAADPSDTAMALQDRQHCHSERLVLHSGDAAPDWRRDVLYEDRRARRDWCGSRKSNHHGCTGKQSEWRLSREASHDPMMRLHSSGSRRGRNRSLSRTLVCCLGPGEEQRRPRRGQARTVFKPALQHKNLLGAEATVHYAVCWFSTSKVVS